VLFAQGQDGTAAPRLAVLRSTNDGFLIAERDLQLRGPGDFFGSRQHGLPAFELADLSEDTELLTSSRTAAQDLLNTDPSLRERPALQAAVRRLVERLG
jgi:ATP-dependent DNA helicase RecG